MINKVRGLRFGLSITACRNCKVCVIVFLANGVIPFSFESEGGMLT